MLNRAEGGGLLQQIATENARAGLPREFELITRSS